MPRNPFEGFDRVAFMRRHWQREPLLIRRAIPGFRDPLRPGDVLRLARSPHAVSRLVVHRGRTWSLEHGPIAASRLKQLPRRGWTVLVQDTNHFSPGADELLSRFDFVPHARIDDVMVSYAVPGGGVGPHVDSYDVFLLQGEGRRRWQISRQKDLAFVPGLDLKILKRFEPEREWILEPGDMLYLPPGVAHHGIAETHCLTWSIGFRAPSDRDLVVNFLDFLRDKLEPAGHYADPGLAMAREAGRIPDRMLEHARNALASIRWSRRDVDDFAGRLLSEPKSHVFFEPPRSPLAAKRFRARCERSGLALDSRSRLLFSGTMFFLNGEALDVAPDARRAMRSLADRRRLQPPIAAGDAFWDLAYAAYLRGFTRPGRDP